MPSHYSNTEGDDQRRPGGCVGQPRPVCPSGQMPSCQNGAWFCRQPTTPQAPPPPSGPANLGDPCISGDPGANTTPPVGNPCGAGRFVKCRDDTRKWGCKLQSVSDAFHKRGAFAPAPALAPARGGGLVGGAFDTLLAPRPSVFSVGANLQPLIEQSLTSLLGAGSRFSEPVLQNLFGTVRAGAATEFQQSRQQAEADFARRGIQRSALAARSDIDLRNRAEARTAEAVTRIRIEKARTDFEDKVIGIERATAYLDRLRAQHLAQESNAIDRERIAATLRLGYSQIDAEKANLMRRLASDRSLLELRYDLDLRNYLAQGAGG